jgi:hypothetical protein
MSDEPKGSAVVTPAKTNERPDKVPPYRKSPRQSKPAPTPVDENEYYTVLHGWGRLLPNEKHFIDASWLFIGGVCREVPGEVINMWYKKAPKMLIHVLPWDATTSDFVTATGLQPLTVPELAAHLQAATPDTIIDALGLERAAELVDALRAQLIARQVG